MVLAQKQIGRSIEQNRDPRNKSRTHLYGELIIDKEPRIYNEERIVFSTDVAGHTGQPHAKELNWTILCHTQKLVQNESKS